MPTPDQGDYPNTYTPAQIEQMYGYSKGLTQGGMRDAEITSPWQGARMMADALAGRSMRNQAGAAQTQANNTAGSNVRQAFQPPGGIPQVQMSPSTTPGSFGTTTPPTPVARPAPPMSQPAPMNASPPVANLQGSIPSGMPGGMPPGGPTGMVNGMQPPPNPMMSALMTQPPGMGMG